MVTLNCGHKAELKNIFEHQWFDGFSTNDNRYNIIREIILKKTDILAEITINNNRFYFEFMFDSFDGDAGLYYCFNDIFEISYFYEKDDTLEEIRTLYQ